MPLGTAYKTLLVEVDDSVATLTLNRPERRNGIGDGMHEELEDFFGAVNRAEEVNCVLMTGAGSAFCIGGDVGRRPESPLEPEAPRIPLSWTRGARRLVTNILEVEVPIVVAVNGDAIGLGATLALLGDVVFAAEHARIGDTHVRIGLVAGDGGALIWPLLIGVNRAKEYLMTGDLLTAPEAERLGLVNHVAPAAELMPTAGAFARRMADGPTWAIRGTKAAINKDLRARMLLSLDTSLALETLTASTSDHREAIRAFLEKRPPSFTGE